MTRVAAALALCGLVAGLPTVAQAQMRAQVVASGFTLPVAFVMDPIDHSTF